MSEEKARLRSRLSNHGFEEIRILAGNIGYLRMNSFSGSREAFETAAAAMCFLASCEAVIIDLRWNPGGDSHMVQVISSYFLGPEPEILDVFHYRDKDHIKQIWSLPFVPHAISINPATEKNFQGTGVEPDMKTNREQALTMAHIQALKRRIGIETDPIVKSELEWALDGLSLRPVRLTPLLRQSYTGSYGPVKITLERGRLYYHFGPGKLRMAPIKDDYFLLENFDAFRIKIIKSNGTVTGIRVFNKGGGKSEFPKTKG